MHLPPPLCVCVPCALSLRPPDPGYLHAPRARFAEARFLRQIRNGTQRKDVDGTGSGTRMQQRQLGLGLGRRSQVGLISSGRLMLRVSVILLRSATVGWVACTIELSEVTSCAVLGVCAPAVSAVAFVSADLRFVPCWRQVDRYFPMRRHFCCIFKSNIGNSTGL